MKRSILTLAALFLASVAWGQALPTGTVVNISKVACSSAVAPGSACTHLVIAQCPGTSNEGVTIGVHAHTAFNLPTIVFFTGSTGTQFYPLSMVNDLYRKGFITIQTNWDRPGWPDTGGTHAKDMKLAACRPATLLKYLKGKYAPISPFGAVGSSTGATAIAASMASFNVHIDNAELLSGPPQSDIKEGCRVPNPPEPIHILPSNGEPWDNGPEYVNQFIQGVSRLTGHECQNPSGTSADDDASWLEQSVVSPGANMFYSTTTFAQWACDNGENNSAAQAYIFYESSVAEDQSFTRISGCHNSEDVENGVTPQGQNGRTAIESDMELNLTFHN